MPTLQEALKAAIAKQRDNRNAIAAKARELADKQQQPEGQEGQTQGK